MAHLDDWEVSSVKNITSMYIYLLQPASHLGTAVYKIGMSSKNDLSRIRSYGKSTQYIGMFSVGDRYLEVEKKLISAFRENFRLSHGREYFEISPTDISKAKVLFLETCISASESSDTSRKNIFESYKFTHQTSVKVSDYSSKTSVKVGDYSSKIYVNKAGESSSKTSVKVSDYSSKKGEPLECRPEHIDPYYMFDRFRFVPK